MTLSVSDGSPSRKEQNDEDEARIVSLCYLCYSMCSTHLKHTNEYEKLKFNWAATQYLLMFTPGIY